MTGGGGVLLPAKLCPCHRWLARLGSIVRHLRSKLSEPTERIRPRPLPWSSPWILLPGVPSCTWQCRSGAFGMTMPYVRMCTPRTSFFTRIPKISWAMPLVVYSSLWGCLLWTCALAFGLSYVLAWLTRHSYVYLSRVCPIVPARRCYLVPIWARTPLSCAAGDVSVAVGSTPNPGVVAFTSRPERAVLEARKSEAAMPMYSTLGHACGTSAATY